MFFADRSKILLLYRICWKLHVRNLLSIFCSRFGAGFIVSGSQDCTLKLWSVPSTLGGQAMTSLYPHLTEKAHDKDINSVVVAPNGKLIASGSQDRTVKVFCLISLLLHSSRLSSTAETIVMDSTEELNVNFNLFVSFHFILLVETRRCTTLHRNY